MLFRSLDDYKADLRKKQETNADNRAKGIFEENVIKAVAANATVDIPHVMVDHEIEQMVEEQRNQMRYQGFELEQYLSYMGQTIDTFKEQLHEPAEDRVRTRLVLEQIAKEEAVAATEEEIEAEIEKMATMYNMKTEDIKSRITDENDNFVTDTIIRRKTVELLVAKAVPVAQPLEIAENPGDAIDVTASDETAGEPAADADTEPEAAPVQET